MRERTIYLKLLTDLRHLKRAVEVVDTRIHELLDEIDKGAAKKIIREVKKDLKL